MNELVRYSLYEGWLELEYKTCRDIWYIRSRKLWDKTVISCLHYVRIILSQVIFIVIIKLFRGSAWMIDLFKTFARNHFAIVSNT